MSSVSVAEPTSKHVAPSVKVCSAYYPIIEVLQYSAHFRIRIETENKYDYHNALYFLSSLLDWSLQCFQFLQPEPVVVPLHWKLVVGGISGIVGTSMIL